MILTWPEIADLSFSDEKIERWTFEPTEKRLSTSFSGGDLDSNGVGRIQTPIDLRVGPWTTFSGNRFPLNAVISPVPDASEALEEVCECEFGEQLVSLSGFGKLSGDWIVYEFRGPAIAEWHPIA